MTTTNNRPSWIRRHPVISGIVGVIVGILISGGISNAVQARRAKTQPQYNITYTNSTPQYTAPQYVPSAPTPAQPWPGDSEGGAYQNAPNQPINSGGFDYSGNS